MSLHPEPDGERRWAEVAAAAASAKKGDDIVLIDVGGILAITDIFVITSAANVRLVRTIVEDVEAKVKQAGGPSPIRTEGLKEAQWVLMDYGDFVVHVFLEEIRRFYDLERLWADAPRSLWVDERPAVVGAD
jgi:ribosome-associated protein